MDTNKKKFFISYSWTDTDQSVTRDIVEMVVDKLQANGHSVYAAINDEMISAGTHGGEAIELALPHIQQRDVLLVLKTSKQRSEGQLMEIGAAKAWQKKVYLFMQYEADDDTYIDDPHISERVVMWKDVDELLAEVEKL